MRSLAIAAGTVFLGAGMGAGPPARAAWRVTGDVRIACPLTVGGSFEASTEALTGTLTLRESSPPSFAGDLSVDMRTLTTGIAARDAHLRNEYLEVHRGSGFETAVLSEVRLGHGDAATLDGRTTFAAMLLVHGVRKAVAGEARIRRAASGVRVDASFPVTLASHGIKEPRYLGVGVGNVVHVKVTVRAVPAADAGS